MKTTTKIIDLRGCKVRLFHRDSVCLEPAVNRQPGFRRQPSTKNWNFQKIETLKIWKNDLENWKFSKAWNVVIQSEKIEKTAKNDPLWNYCTQMEISFAWSTGARSHHFNT